MGEIGYVKEGSRNGHLSPLGPHWRIWRGDHLPGILRDEEEILKQGISFSVGAL